ncbi:glycosyltransferase family 2 protein [Patescibacteria group bacterium]
MITGCILTRNCQEDLLNLLPSISFLDEIVIVDDYSTDNTREIAKSFNARIYKRKLDNNFASQRNYALSKAKKGWIFFIDSDERVTSSLGNEIQKAVKENKSNGFYIKRTDIFLGKKLKFGETSRIKLVRLAKKGYGKWKRPVHEYWDVKTKKTLKNPLIHHSHKNISSFVNKLNVYTNIESNLRKKQGKKTNIFEITVFPIGKFIQNYIIKLGFLDGFRGFVMASMMSIHSFLVRAKLQTNK